MGNFVNMSAIVFDLCNPQSWWALLAQFWCLVQTTIYRVLGLFADLLNIAFYIFAGVDISSTPSGESGIYDIKVNGEKKNILDYFLFSDVMKKSYLLLALLGLLLVVIFTIYKIVKQDYFEKAGPRSKGPIFRNVAISCISFLLVIPIFYLIIHASSLLAVVVMDAMGMDASQFAGAKIFSLSWSDGGEAMRYVNGMLNESGIYDLKWMQDLNNQTLFTLTIDGAKVSLDNDIMTKLGNPVWKSGKIGDANIIAKGGAVIQSADFFWYIYLVGVIVAIKNLYMLIKAMIQRIFMLMGLFIVAPSPISQYVLDDGAKFKRWLNSSIDQGLRLVVATVSFSIFLIALSLIGKIDFISAFNSAIDSASTNGSALDYNVSADMLVYNTEPLKYSVSNMLTESAPSIFDNLVNAFMRILLLMAAGGAITDLGALLDPLIGNGTTGGKALESGQAGAGVGAGLKAAKAGVGMVTGLAGAVAGGIAGGIAGGFKNANAGKAGDKAGAEAEKADAQKIEKPEDKKDDTAKPSGPDGGDSPNTSTAKEADNSKNGDNKDAEAVKPEGENKEASEAVDAQNATEENQNGDADNKDADADDVKAPENADENKVEGDGEGDEKVESPDGDENKPEDVEEENKDAAGEEQQKATNDDKAVDKEKVENSESQKATPMDQKQSSGLGARLANTTKHYAGKAGKKIAGGALTALKGTVKAVPGAVRGATKGALKYAGQTVLGLGKKLLSAVGINTAPMVAVYKNTRKDMDESGKKTYNKHKEEQYNVNRQARLSNAKADLENKGKKVSDSATNLESAVKKENQAVDSLDEASANAASTAIIANGASAEAANDAGVLEAFGADPNEASTLEKHQEAKDGLQAKNDAIVKKYGSKEDMERVLAETDSNDPKYKEYDTALKSYNKNQKAITKAENSINSIKENQQTREKTLKTMTGKDGQLAKLGITTGTSFKEAKEIVDKSGNEEMKALFAQANAKVVYENKRVSEARSAHAEADKAQTELGKAKQNYNTAHEEREQAQNELTKNANDYSKSSEIVEKMADSISQRIDTASNAGEEYRRQKEKAKYEGGQAPKKQKYVARALDGATNFGKQARLDMSMAGTRKMTKTTTAQVEAAKTSVQNINAPRTLNTVDDVVDYARNKVTQTTAATSQAAKKLDDYVGKNASVVVTNEGAKLGDYVKNYNGPTSDALDSLYKMSNSKQKASVFTPELQGLMNDHSAAVTKQVAARNTESQTVKMANALSTVSSANIKRASDIKDKLEARREDVEALNGIIENGGSSISDENRSLIGQTLGLRGGKTKATKPEVIVERAKEAKTKIVQEQCDLIRRSNNVKADNDKSTNELKAALDSLVRASSAKMDKSSSSPTNNQTNNNQNVTNQNTVINNNTTNETQSGPVSQNFDPLSSILNQKGDTNNLERKIDLDAISERLQTEGIKHLEHMMDQMQQESKIILDKVEKIEDKLDN